MKHFKPYMRHIVKANDYWKANIAPNYPRVDFRTWLKVKYRVFLARNWSQVGFESSEKELMFVLRWS